MVHCFGLVGVMADDLPSVVSRLISSYSTMAFGRIDSRRVLSSPLPLAGSRRAKLALRGRGWGSTRGLPLGLTGKVPNFSSNRNYADRSRAWTPLATEV